MKYLLWDGNKSETFLPAAQLSFQFFVVAKELYAF